MPEINKLYGGLFSLSNTKISSNTMEYHFFSEEWVVEKWFVARN